MANRVLLNAVGLKVSKPGQNVLTATDAQLAFSSDWSAFGILQQSTHTVVFPTQNAGSFSQTIAFGQTFPTVPFVAFEHLVGSQYRRAETGRFRFHKRARIWRQQQGGNYVYANNAEYRVVVTPTTSGLSVAVSYDRANRTLTIPNLTFRWTLFTYNY